MKNKIIILILLLVCAMAVSRENDLWQILDNTTWHYDNNWAGESLAFYTTLTGYKRAIWQVHGSGVCVALSMVFDVKIEDNEIILTVLPIINNYPEVDWGKKYIYNHDNNELSSIDNEIKLTLLYSKAVARDMWCNDILPQLKEENYEGIESIPHNKAEEK
jgi:hypothetical protein